MEITRENTYYQSSTYRAVCVRTAARHLGVFREELVHIFEVLRH